MRTILFSVIGYVCFAASTLGDRECDARIDARIDELIEQLNDPDNDQLRSTGDEVRKLPVEALPALQKALKEKPMSWVALVAFRKGIEWIEAGRDGLNIPARIQKRLDWYRKHMVEAYKSIGHRDPKWDADVIDGLDRNARAWANDPTYDERVGFYINKRFEAATEKGCKDPLVEYCLASRYRLIEAADDDQRFKLYDQASTGFEKHAYHAAFQAGAMNWRNFYKLKGTSLVDPEARKVEEAYNARYLALLPSVVKDKDMPAFDVYNYLNAFLLSHRRLGGDRQKAWEKLSAQLKEAGMNASVVQAFHGKVRIDLGWDARGDGWAADVKPEAWEIFHAHIDGAGDALLDAIKLDETNSEAAKHFITVCTAASAQRKSMEGAFRHVMHIDPDDHGACRLKMNYLLPRWHGSREELVQFARQCLLTGNWEGHVPDMMFIIHEHLALYTKEGELMKRKDPDYYSRPGVWPDIQAYFEGYLKRFPEDPLAHQRYAYCARSAKQWKIAQREFKAAGEQWPDYRIFPITKQEYDAILAEVAKNAAE